MRDVAVVVEHGTPFMFSDSQDSVSKMKSFLSNGDSTVSHTFSCFVFWPCLDKQLTLQIIALMYKLFLL